MTYLKASEIKSSARGKMLGKYNTAAGAFLLMQLMVFAINIVVNGAVDRNSLFGSVVFGIIAVIVELIIAVFKVGELTIYLNIAADKKARARDIFSYLKVHPDKAIVLELIMFFRIFVWTIPAVIIAVIFSTMQINTGLMLIMLIVGIAGIIKAVLVSIDMSQAFYLLLDFPQYTVKELLVFSKEIMKGHRMTYVGLSLSFIPYYILGALSMGIGMLFAYPYSKMAYTQFYLDIIKEPEKTETEGAEGDGEAEAEVVPIDEAVEVIVGSNVDLVAKDSISETDSE